jgi:hypothetical protein
MYIGGMVGRDVFLLAPGQSVCCVVLRALVILAQLESAIVVFEVAPADDRPHMHARAFLRVATEQP